MVSYFKTVRGGVIAGLSMLPTKPGDVPVSDTDEDVAEFIALHGRPERFGYVGIKPVPKATAGNFMKALIVLGWHDDIQAAVDSLNGTPGQVARALWNRAVEFPRYDPLVLQIAAAVGMTEADIDEVFELADSYNTPS